MANDTSYDIKNSNEKSYTQEEVTKYNKRILLLAWIIPFFALFLMHMGRKKMPEQSKKIMCEILNLEFTASLILTLYMSALNTIILLNKDQKSTLPFIMIVIFLIFVSIFIGIKAVGTAKWLKGEDYSFKKVIRFFKPY